MFNQVSCASVQLSFRLGDVDLTVRKEYLRLLQLIGFSQYFMTNISGAISHTSLLQGVYNKSIVTLNSFPEFNDFLWKVGNFQTKRIDLNSKRLQIYLLVE